MTNTNIKFNLENEGYKIVRQNIFNISIEILNEFHDILKNDEIPTHGNFKNIKVIKNINKFKFLNNIYKELTSILKKNNIADYKFEDVWAQKSEHITTQPGELPFIPHIDKIRKFKVMIYLNDVAEESGPIHFVKCKPNNYENFRKNLGKNYKANKENEIKDFDISDYENCNGPVGTIIFFDTNCPHFAETIKKENFDSRYIYRFNFIINQKNSFLKKLKERIFKTK